MRSGDSFFLKEDCRTMSGQEIFFYSRGLEVFLFIKRTGGSFILKKERRCFYSQKGLEVILILKRTGGSCLLKGLEGLVFFKKTGGSCLLQED